jgi:mRNA interferase MazF
MQRGEVWTAALNPNRGAEVGKTRPVLVLQEDRLTRAGLPTVLAAPLTTQFRPVLAPLRLRIAARDRLAIDSYVMVEHVRALDRSRFRDGPLTALTEEEMAAVEKSLRAVMGMM